MRDRCQTSASLRVQIRQGLLMCRATIKLSCAVNVKFTGFNLGTNSLQMKNYGKNFYNFALFLVVALPLSGLQAWTKLTVIDGDSYYVDVASVDHSDKTAWLRVDLRREMTVNGRGVSSTRELMQFDCTSNRVRSLELAAFSEKGLRGYIVESRLTSLEWRRIPPNAPLKKVRQLLCG